MAKSLYHWISGEKFHQQSGKFGDVFDPATGDVVSRVPFGGVEEIAAAISAATDALPNWAATPPIQRARVMFRFKALIEEHMDDIAVLVSSEHGKTLEDARGSITRGLEVV